jgi:hypothetical protein
MKKKGDNLSLLSEFKHFVRMFEIVSHSDIDRLVGS